MWNCSCRGPSEGFLSRRGFRTNPFTRFSNPSTSSTNHRRDGFISAEQMSFPDAFAQTQEVQCGHAECEALVFTAVARQLG